MTEKIDLYNYQKRYEQKYVLFEKSDIRERNKQIIRNMLLQLQIENLSWNRQFKYLVNLQKVEKMIDGNFEDATEESITQVLLKISICKPTMRTIYSITLKRVYKFLRRKDIASMIKIKNTKSNITPEMLITINELQALIKNAETEKEACTYAVAYEAGLRPGEILKIPRSRILFDEHGAKLIPDDKTGPRTVRIVKSAELLKKYLKKCKDEYPFLLKIHQLELQLQKTAEHAGITRRIWPYLFRHTNATQWHGKLPDMLFKKRYGWTQESRMPANYVHLNDSDLDEATLNAYGIKKSNWNEYVTTKALF